MVVLATAFFAGAGTSSAVGIGDYSAGDAAGGIGSSRHNMGSLGRVITAMETTQICVFCHTPHHSVGDATTNGPLWNRSDSNASTYTAYGTTAAGTTIADGDLGGATLACLSCHDGVTTFDNLVNRPGKDTASGDQGWSFKMPGIGPVLNTGFDHFGASVAGISCDACHTVIFSIGEQASRLNIGTALSNDHPVSVPYTPGTASLRATNTDIDSIDLSSGLGSTNANVMQNLWAVKGYFNTDATINDLLRDNANVSGRTVECSSCHDPHFRNLSWDEVESTWNSGGSTWCGTGEDCSDGMFLRRVGGNTGSGVCRTCHNK
jgi:hypothetical protein